MSDLAEYILRKKAQFMGTVSKDVENESVFQANEGINSAIDNQVIDYTVWKGYHDDISDWGMQKTLAEIHSLPVKERSYREYFV